MKRFISILVKLLFLLLIIGNNNCSQKDVEVKNINNQEKQIPAKKALAKVDDPNSLTHDQIILFSTRSQKLLFSKMNSTSKARIWLERVSYVSSFYRNSIKREKILELKTFINAELFSNKLYLNSIEKEIQKWIDNNISAFGLNNLRLILTTLSELAITNSQNNDFSEVTKEANPCPPCDGDPNACTCSTRSDWCSGSNICGTGYNCTQVSGCGTFLAYTCDGRCGMW